MAEKPESPVSAVAGIKRLAVAVAAVIVAAFGILLMLSILIPADTVREKVQAQIRAVTGLDPVLSGDIAVSLFPTGSVRFHDVSLGDIQAGTSALTAEQLVVRLRFLPFLIGQIEIADVTLVRPTITIAFAPNGRSNWAGHVETLARALQPSPDRVKSFSEIRIADGTVLLHDDTFKVVETLTSVDVALAWPSISKSFAATGRFVWHDEPIDATLSLTDFVAALVGDRSGVKLRLGGAPLKFAFDGNFSHRPTFKMEGMLAADAISMRETLRWAANWAPPGGGFGRFAIKAQTSVVGGTISLSGVNVELDGNSGEGVLTFASDGRQTLQGTLAAEALDLTPYITAYRLMTGNDWNRRPISVAGLGGLDVDLRLSAARVALGATKLGRTAVAANLRGGNLTVAVGESQVFGGTVNGSFGLASSAAGAEIKAQLRFSDIALEQALGDLVGIRRLEGKGDLGFTLDSSGGNVYELTQALNGSASLVSPKGAIVGINVEQLLRRLERNPLAGRGDFRSGKTPFDLLAINLKIAQGTASVDEVRIEGPAVRLALAGFVSIPTRDLDLKGTASLVASTARDAAPPFELPFMVQGAWGDPLIWPDAQALINRSGAAAPLLDAVRSRLKREHARPPEAPAAAVSGPSAAPPAAQPASSAE
ncbi:MAG: AsmA protein [Alphaproteobacteria bacterium]|jgi:AsmA protein|nr:AsmA protein [Alphaproteobacteria bacterium]